MKVKRIQGCLSSQFFFLFSLGTFQNTVFLTIFDFYGNKQIFSNTSIHISLKSNIDFYFQTLKDIFVGQRN